MSTMSSEARAARARAARARANALGWDGEAPGSPRRSRARIAGGIILLIVFAWVAAALYLSVGSREEVVALARPVDRFAELTAEDLRVVRVAADPAVGLVSGDSIDELVGRVAATELVAGALLHEDHLLDADERLVGPDEATVGAVLSAQDSPGNLVAGADVEVIVRPPTGSTDTVLTLEGWVLEVEAIDDPGASGDRVTLVVPAESVATVAAGASEGRVSLAVLGT